MLNVIWCQNTQNFDFLAFPKYIVWHNSFTPLCLVASFWIMKSSAFESKDNINILNAYLELPGLTHFIKHLVARLARRVRLHDFINLFEKIRKNKNPKKDLWTNSYYFIYCTYIPNIFLMPCPHKLPCPVSKQPDLFSTSDHSYLWTLIRYVNETPNLSSFESFMSVEFFYSTRLAYREPFQIFLISFFEDWHWIWILFRVHRDHPYYNTARSCQDINLQLLW